MKESSFYNIRENESVVSVVKSYSNFSKHISEIINLFEEDKPLYIFENLITPDKLTNYSIIGLECIDIEFECLEKFYSRKEENKNYKYTCEDIYKYKSSLIDIPFVDGVVGRIGYNAVEDFYNMNLKIKSKVPKYNFKLSKLLVLINHTKNKLYIIYNSFKEISSYENSKENNNLETYDHVVSEITKVRNKIFSNSAISNQELVKGFSIKANLEKGKIEKNKKNISITFKSSNTKEEFIEKVNLAKIHIREGDIFQVVLSNKFVAKANIDEFELYKNLKITSNSVYKSIIRFNNIITICSSPETLVRKNDSYIETYPIAGTRAVKNNGKDEIREYELLNDQKELSEHLMLVDLGRNDISKVCKFGSVKVKEFCEVKRFSKVMHLVSRVEGKPLKQISLLDPIKATFPAGTVSGAPKIRAIQIIDEIENSSRDLYAGAIVVIDDNANIDTCISIRTIQIINNELIVQAGAGIVNESIGENEHIEIMNKSKAMFEAIEMTHEGDVLYDFSN